MENVEPALRGSISTAVPPVTTSYWLVSDAARPRSDTGDLIIVGEKRTPALHCKLKFLYSAMLCCLVAEDESIGNHLGASQW
jgi:hypothetical protein